MAVHVAITRNVKPGSEAEFERALRDFLQASFALGGVLGTHMIVPPPGSMRREYGILRTFADEAERELFYRSPLFEAWKARVASLTEGDPVYRELSGLEAWFRTGQSLPSRWKMAVATLAGVYPTSVVLALTVGEVLHAWPLLARSFVFAVCMVALLTWGVMPIVTRLLREWLHARAEE
jgi:antibiotic biosynthesis monooxygenase (ABM) superfamily enzyme